MDYYRRYEIADAISKPATLDAVKLTTGAEHVECNSTDEQDNLNEIQKHKNAQPYYRVNERW